VNLSTAERNSTPKRLSVVSCCAVVTLVASLLAAALGAVAFVMFGVSGLAAAILAVGICWASEVAAIVIQYRLNDDSLIVASTLAGLMARMFPPLAACAVVGLQAGKLAQGGFIYWTLGVYLVFLTLHTVWFVPRVEQPATDGASANGV
jgi:hypothetical protein